MSLCHFLVILNSLLIFFIIIVFAVMICGIIITKRWGLAEGSGDGSNFLAIKYFLIRVYVFLDIMLLNT